MNPATLARAEKILVDVQKGLSGRHGQSDIAIAPPLPFIAELSQLAGAQKIEFVAQDVSVVSEGAHTGEVGAGQLRSIGVKCAIVGHSERRAAGETDEEVNLKIKALHALKSTAILCVGERERDRSGDYFNVVEDQLRSALADVDEADLKLVVIAYEPVWAIGTGKNASATEAEEMKLFIHKILADMFAREKSEAVRVLSGGSVTPDNAEELLSVGKVDGFLVGGASLDAKQFVAIVKIADQYARMA
jgi:triosephosphate isomerase